MRMLRDDIIRARHSCLSDNITNTVYDEIKVNIAYAEMLGSPFGFELRIIGPIRMKLLGLE